MIRVSVVIPPLANIKSKKWLFAAKRIEWNILDKLKSYSSAAIELIFASSYLTRKLAGEKQDSLISVARRRSARADDLPPCPQDTR
jgi:hypothetical protein